jgi:hypothetical protein
MKIPGQLSVKTNKLNDNGVGVHGIALHGASLLGHEVNLGASTR